MKVDEIIQLIGKRARVSGKSGKTVIGELFDFDNEEKSVSIVDEKTGAPVCFYLDKVDCISEA